MITWLLKVRIKTIVLLVIILIIFFFKKRIKDENESKRTILLWWTPFLYEDQKLISCETIYECIVTKNRSLRERATAFLFYGSNFDKNDLPLPKNNVPWAMFHEESPKNLPFFLYREGQEMFNITSTFSRNSDLPLTLQYLEDIEAITDTRYYLPVDEKNKLLKEIAPVLYIQSDCETPVERDFYVSELMKFIKVDSYGKCLNNKKMPKELTLEKTLENLYDPDLMKFVSRYKFSIAIENAVCQDYITEKLWRPLMAGSIPIYLGSPSIKEWLPTSRSALLISDYDNISNLADYIKTINSNDTLYKQYMEHKILRKISNHRLKNACRKGSFGIENNDDFTIPAFECFVCKTINKGLYRRHYDSVYTCEKPKSNNLSIQNWWITHWESGKCEAKTLQYFIETLKVSNYSKETFENKYAELLQNRYC